jgi:hypothetical protein
MTRVRVKRMDGSTEGVEVADRQHYEVAIEGEEDGDFYVRYVLIMADDARTARARAGVEEGEKVDTTRKITRGEVAVLVLNGMTVR